MNAQDKVDQEMRDAWAALLVACNREDHTVAHWLVDAATRDVRRTLTEAEDEVLRAERFPGALSTDSLALAPVEDRVGDAMRRVTTRRAQLRFLLALARKLDGVAAAEFGRMFAAHLRAKREPKAKPGAVEKGGA